jgi:hypothetical protein
MSKIRARSFECTASRSHIAIENTSNRIKRDAWLLTGHLSLNDQQISTELTLQEQRIIEQIGTRIYGIKQIKG